MSKDEILELAKFDLSNAIENAATAKYSVHPAMDIGALFVSGCKHENAKLLTIIEALVESREELKQALEFALQPFSGPVDFSALKEALANDDARMASLGER